MKKILHIAETLPGGISGYLEEFFCGFEGEEYKNYLIFPDTHCAYVPDAIDRENTFSYRRGGRDLISLFRLLIKIASINKIVKPDFIVLHSSFAGFLGRLWAFFQPGGISAKIIYIPHGIAFIMPNLNTAKKSVYKGIERFLAKKTDLLIAVSDYERNVIELNGVRSRKNVVIKHGVIIDKCQERKAVENHEAVNILFVGRFDNEKGLPRLLEAVSKSQIKYKLRIVGDFSSSTKRRESNAVNFSCVAEQYSWCSRSELSAHYAWADYVVVPSEWEALGLVAIEAIGHGVPVVTSGVGGLSEIVIDGFNGFLYSNLEQLVNIIDDLPNKNRQVLSLNARDFYLNNFTPALMIEKTKHYMESL